jgi:hypothetical protein
MAHAQPAPFTPWAWIEIGDATAQSVVLVGDRTTIGRPGADIPLEDETVSRLHAVIEGMSTRWVLHDLGSTNGTTVNGRRVTGAQVLHKGDLLGFGSSVVAFHCEDAPEAANQTTAPRHPAPRLTPREHDLLVALCRPVFEGAIISEPASLRAMAVELVVTESAVKKLLSRAYDKFGLAGGDRRRGCLAAEAVRRGVITVHDCR